MTWLHLIEITAAAFVGYAIGSAVGVRMLRKHDRRRTGRQGATSNVDP